MTSITDVERNVFARQQAEMTANWNENLKRTHQDVKEYIGARHKAYLDRWSEAGRFIQSGDRVLDIGGGNLFPELIDYFKSKQIDYHYLDIDQSAVDGSRNLLTQKGFDSSKASQGFNDALSYPQDAFDCVFSSHCIEHSIDLASTFRELNRIIRTGGNLLMAVPFGWEESPEHPYFFDPEQWQALVQDAGFQVRVAQVGCEYPETGYDFFIAARKIGDPDPLPRIDADRFKKENYDFIGFESPAVRYFGNNVRADGGMAQHLRGNDWAISIELPELAKEVLPIMLRHDWSGTASMRNELGDTVATDLYSWFPYVAAPRLTSSGAMFAKVEVSCTGRSGVSRSTEGVFFGAMWR